MNEEQVPETGEIPVEKGKRKRAKRAGKKISKRKDVQDQMLIEMGDKEAYANYERRKMEREKTKNNALKKKDMKLNLETGIQEGDKEAEAERKKLAQEKTKMAQEKAKNDALKKKEMQLYLETRFQEVVTKHKMLIQNRPPVPHKPATSFVISLKKKQLKPQPNSQLNPTEPKTKPNPKLKPKPAHQMAVAKWESVANIRTVFGLMTAGQSLVQMPATALITPGQCEQQSGSAGQAPAQSLEQLGPASEAPGQSLEQSGPVGQPPGQNLQQMGPAATNCGQDVTVTPGQSGQQPETIPALRKRK